MTTDTALIEKREELKRRLAAGEYKTLVDVLLDGLGRIIQKITRYPRPISHWVSSAILFLIILLIPATLDRLGEPILFTTPTATLFPGFFLLRILLGYSNIAIMVAANIYLHRVFTTFNESILDNVESVNTIDDFEHWLISVCNRRVHFAMSVLGGALLGAYLIFTLVASDILVPLGTAIATLLLSIFSLAFMYLLIYMVILSARIGSYRLKLYIANPGSSEVISKIAGLLGNFLYLVAMYAAFITLAVALTGFFTRTSVVLLPVFWLPILAMFVLNRRSISSIINRAKWKTLNEIQERVEQMHTSKKLGEKETMETINRLIDYYDRIKNARNSTFDRDMILNLINSLLFPLLAFLLGNLDKLMALLPQRP